MMLPQYCHGFCVDGTIQLSDRSLAMGRLTLNYAVAVRFCPAQPNPDIVDEYAFSETPGIELANKGNEYRAVTVYVALENNLTMQ